MFCFIVYTLESVSCLISHLLCTGSKRVQFRSVFLPPRLSSLLKSIETRQPWLVDAFFSASLDAFDLDLMICNAFVFNLGMSFAVLLCRMQSMQTLPLIASLARLLRRAFARGEFRGACGESASVSRVAHLRTCARPERAAHPRARRRQQQQLQREALFRERAEKLSRERHCVAAPHVSARTSRARAAPPLAPAHELLGAAAIRTSAVHLRRRLLHLQFCCSFLLWLASSKQPVACVHAHRTVHGGSHQLRIPLFFTYVS